MAGRTSGTHRDRRCPALQLLIVVAIAAAVAGIALPRYISGAKDTTLVRNLGTLELQVKSLAALDLDPTFMPDPDRLASASVGDSRRLPGRRHQQHLGRPRHRAAAGRRRRCRQVRQPGQPQHRRRLPVCSAVVQRRSAAGGVDHGRRGVRLRGSGVPAASATAWPAHCWSSSTRTGPTPARSTCTASTLPDRPHLRSRLWRSDSRPGGRGAAARAPLLSALPRGSCRRILTPPGTADRGEEAWTTTAQARRRRCPRASAGSRRRCSATRSPCRSGSSRSGRRSTPSRARCARSTTSRRSMRPSVSPTCRRASGTRTRPAWATTACRVRCGRSRWTAS